MAELIYTDCKMYVGGYDVSGYHTQTKIDHKQELHETTCLDDAARTRTSGLQSVDISSSGNWEATDTDTPFFTGLGTVDQEITICPDGNAAGDLAYFTQGVQADYNILGPIGEIVPYDIVAHGSGGYGLARGEILANVSGALTGVSTSTKREITTEAVNTVYAILHVTSVSGTTPTLDVLVQSDADGSAGGETTRITFTQMGAVGSQYATPITNMTEDYWRLSYTIGGSDTPTFSFIVAIAIF